MIASGPNPLLGLELLDTLTLYGLIFAPLPNIEPSAAISPNASRDAIHLGSIFNSLLNPSSSRNPVSASLNKLLSPAQDKTVRKRLWLAIALAPLRELTYMEKKKQTSLSETIIKDSIKVRLHIFRCHADQSLIVDFTATKHRKSFRCAYSRGLSQALIPYIV
jgi:tRNA nucleotidyltransferase (CCA-adding enzyme)